MDDRAELKRRGDELRARLRAKDPEGKHRPWEKKQTAQEVKRAVLDVDCIWRGELTHSEPCKCGAARKVDVYRCENQEVKKTYCVPLSMEWNKLKDPDAKRQYVPARTA